MIRGSFYPIANAVLVLGPRCTPSQLNRCAMSPITHISVESQRLAVVASRFDRSDAVLEYPLGKALPVGIGSPRANISVGVVR